MTILSLLQLIKSLSSIEKREFKTNYGRKNGNQGYLKLFDYLNKVSKGSFVAGKLESRVASALKLNSKELYRLKTDLKSNLFAFLSKTSKSPKKRIFSLYLSALELFSRRNYSLAKSAIREGKELAQVWEEFDLWKQLIQLEVKLPIRFQSSSINNEVKEIDKYLEEVSTLNNILDRIKDWLKDRKADSPKISLIDQLSSHPILKRENLPHTDKAKRLFYLANRRLASLQSDWEKSSQFSLNYICLIEDSIIFQLDSDGMVVEELSQVAHIYEVAGKQNAFWDILEKIKQYKPKTTIGKLKAFRAYYEPLIWRVADYGDVERGRTIIPIIRSKIREFEHELEDKYKIYFAFHAARFQFIAKEYKDSLLWIRYLFTFDKAGAAFEIFYPFALLLEVLCHCELKNHSLVDFLASSLKRKMTKKDHFLNYFTLVLNCIKIVMDHPATSAKRKLERKLNNLTILLNNYTDDYQPFNFLNPIPWVVSKIKGVPFELILQNDQVEREASQSQINQAKSG